MYYVCINKNFQIDCITHVMTIYVLRVYNKTLSYHPDAAPEKSLVKIPNLSVSLFFPFWFSYLQRILAVFIIIRLWDRDWLMCAHRGPIPKISPHDRWMKRGSQNSTRLFANWDIKWYAAVIVSVKSEQKKEKYDEIAEKAETNQDIIYHFIKYTCIFKS